MLKTWTKVVDSGSNRLSRVYVESKLLETKPFQLIIKKDRSGMMSLAEIKNWESRGNNRESNLDSWLDSREDQVYCQLTFELYCKKHCVTRQNWKNAWASYESSFEMRKPSAKFWETRNQHFLHSLLERISRNDLFLEKHNNNHLHIQRTNWPTALANAI